MSTPLECKEEGNAALKRKEYQAALEAYTRGLSLAGESGADELRGTLYSNRAAVHATLGDWSSSLQDAENALELRPTWDKAMSRKATALYNLDRVDESIEWFERVAAAGGNADAGLALARRKQKAAEANVLGEECLNKGKYEQAEAHFTRAIEALDTWSLLYCNRSRARAMRGYYNEAIQDADAAINCRPTWHRGYQRRAEALHGFGRYDDALAAYVRAQELNPDDAKLRSAFQQCLADKTNAANRKAMEATIKEREEKEAKEKKSKSKSSSAKSSSNDLAGDEDDAEMKDAGGGQDQQEGDEGDGGGDGSSEPAKKKSWKDKIFSKK